MNRVVILLCVLLLEAVPAKAQIPQAELSGGYSFLKDHDRHQTFPAGWVAAATRNVADWVGVTVELGAGYGTCEDCQRGPFTSQEFRGEDLRLRVYSYLIGPRFAVRATPAVTPFAQYLFGGSHISGGAQFDGALTSGLTHQLGGGVDVRIAPKVGIRLQGDYRMIRTEGLNNRQSRLLVGLVVRSGQR